MHSREENGGEVRDYSSLRDCIGRLAQKGLQFVLLFDELERITSIKAFDANFFGNLRALGERPEYRLGYLIASRRSLYKDWFGDFDHNQDRIDQGLREGLDNFDNFERGFSLS